MANTVLITGGSRGIGAATALRFAQAGWQVCINYHSNHAAAQALVAQLQALGTDAIAIQGDISDSCQAQSLVEGAIKHFGGLDALVCNAGISQFGLLSDVTDTQWREMMGTNLDGAFYTIRAALPHLVGQKSGSIVTVSSMWGVTGASCEVPYSTAKAGLIGLTKGLAKELGPSNIRVNCVAPGVIDTEMNGHLSPEDLSSLAEETPLGRLGTPAEVADATYFLSTPQASFITGQVLQPNGGILI